MNIKKIKHSIETIQIFDKIKVGKIPCKKNEIEQTIKSVDD